MSDVTFHYRFLSAGPLPVWLGVVLVVASLVAVVWLLNREYKGRRGKARSRWLYVIRAAVVVCLALLVIQPVLFIRRDETRPALLMLVTDRSRSMLRSDPYDESTLLNLATALGIFDLKERDDLPDRVRKELLAWQRDLERSQARVAQMRDDLSQGTPPRSEFEKGAKETSAQLQAMNAKLRSQCDDLAKLQTRLIPKTDAASTNAVKGLDPQWFAAPAQFMDRMAKLEEQLRAIGSGELSEEKAASLLHMHEDALAGHNVAVAALSSLQTYCDVQLEKSLTEKQRAELQRLAGMSRFALATRALAMSTNAGIATNHTIQLVGATPLDANNAEDHTDLYETVKQTLASVGQKTVAGIVLVSDGQQNLPSRPEIMRELRGRNIPFIVAEVGLPETMPDAAIKNYEMPTTLLAGSRITVRADLKTAVPTNTELSLTLSLNGTALAEKRWKAEAPETQVSLEFPVPSSLNAPLVLAVKMPQPDGAPNNDQVEIGVTVLPEQARVLVIAPSPRWDIVYLLKALSHKPWRVDTVFWKKGQDEDSDKADTSDVAKQLAQLKNYQLVVLDGKPFDDMTADDVNLIKNYVVKDGGNLLVIASDSGSWYGEKLSLLIGSVSSQAPSENSAHLESTQDAANLPVVSLAADGEESVAIWKRLAAPQQVRPVPAQDISLLTYRQQPCLSLGFHGRGKIYALGCADLFRLREWDGAPIVNRFFANLIDDALRPVFPSATSKLAVYPNMPVARSTAHVLVEGSSDKPATTGQLTFEWGGGGTLKFERTNSSSFSHARLHLGKPSRFTLDVPGLEKLAGVSLATVSLEDVNFGLDAERLRSLAELANGTHVSLPDLAHQLSTVPPKKDVTTTMRVVRIWNLGALLVLIVALMTTDWILRRRSGLVL